MPDGRAVDCRPIVDVCLRAGSIPAFGIGVSCYFELQEHGVIGSILVSKTIGPGSSPGAPAKVIFRRRGGIGNRAGLLHQKAPGCLCEFESHRLR